MKIRIGFVSNSSSSSFVIALRDITASQLDAILNHSAIGQERGLLYADDAWHIEQDREVVRGSTNMNNFDMEEFFDVMGIPGSVVEWDD